MPIHLRSLISIEMVPDGAQQFGVKVCASPDGREETLLSIEGLTVAYQVGGQWLDAVRDFSLQLEAGCTYGLVGESGSGKSTVEKRVGRAGYTWQAVGENVAGGLESSEAVVAGWLNSPSHCANIMEPAFTEIGAACVNNSKSRYGTYWTLVLAAPLK